MMPELSLNVLDIAQNSVKARASLIGITVEADTAKDLLTIIIEDNGCGMTEEQINKVTDPFFTTRTVRKVGLGVPFFKMAAETAGGSFKISSSVNVGTTVTAVFVLSNIDRMPLGDMPATIHSLVTLNSHIDFVYKFKVDDREFVMDTREFRAVLGDSARFDIPEVSSFIKSYLEENSAEVTSGVIL